MSLSDLTARALSAIDSAASAKALDDIRVQFTGKSGELTAELKTLGTLPPEERKAKGAEVNAARDQITAALDAKKTTLEAAELDARLANETIDITNSSPASASTWFMGNRAATEAVMNPPNAANRLL